MHAAHRFWGVHTFREALIYSLAGRRTHCLPRVHRTLQVEYFHGVSWTNAPSKYRGLSGHWGFRKDFILFTVLLQAIAQS